MGRSRRVLKAEFLDFFANNFDLLVERSIAFCWKISLELKLDSMIPCQS